MAKADNPKHLGASPYLKHKIKNQITCPVCLDVFQEPKSLSCQHALCLACIEGMPVDITKGAHVVKCPTCRQPTILPNGCASKLSPAFQTNVMKDLYDSVRVFPVRQPSTEYPQCLSHKRSMDMFCQKCQKVICAVCGVREHSNHKFGLIIDLYPQQKQEVEDQLDNVKQQLNIFLSALHALNTREKEITQQVDYAKREIDALVQAITEAAQKTGKRLKENIDMLVLPKMTLISTQKSKIEDTITQIKSCEEYVAEVLHRRSQDDMLQEKSQLLAKMKSVTKKVSTVELPSKEGYVFIPNHDVVEKCGNIGEISGKILPAETKSNSLATAKCSGKGSVVAMVGMSMTFDISFPTKPDGSLSCYLYNEDGGPVVQCSLNPCHRKSFLGRKKSGYTYTVNYTSTHVGLHHIILHVDEVDVSCSPSTIRVLPSPGMRQQLVKNRQFRVLGTASLKKPRGIAMDFDYRTLVVSEEDNHTVAVCDLEGCVVTRFGERGTKKGQLRYPLGLVSTSDGHVIIADSVNNRIQKFSMSGDCVECVGLKGSGRLEFGLPCDVAIDSQGRVYVSDTDNCRIQVLHPDLSFSHMFGGRGSEKGKIMYTGGIAIDSQDTIYICDSLNSRIQSFTTEGEFMGEFGVGEIKEPLYIAVDPYDVVYVIDNEDGRLVMFDSDKECLGSVRCDVLQPRGLAVDSKGNVYICTDKNISIL